MSCFIALLIICCQCLYSIKVVQFDQTFSNMAPGVLNGGVAVYIGQQTQAKAVAVVGGVGKAVHQHAGGGGLERLPHPIIQLIVHNGAPVLGFLIGHRLNICTEDGGKFNQWIQTAQEHTHNGLFYCIEEDML